MKLSNVICFLLLCALFPSLSPVKAQAADEKYTVPVYLEGNYRGLVRAYDGSYFGNTYLSLTDLSAILNGTEKRFRFERVVSSADGEYFTITENQDNVLPSGADSFTERTLTASLNPYRNRLLVNGDDRKYYTHNPQNGDLYMSLTDVQLMLDFTAELMDGNLILHIGRPFVPDLNSLQAQGYFSMVDSVFLGDATTGEVLYTLNGEQAVPVASLSKLLSYLVLKDAVAAGEIQENDQVLISANAEALSLSGDGIIPMKAGNLVPFSELMEGMLVASSNESALALAEHLCGSEAEFVSRMHSTAAGLSLNTATMYNASGLPSYAEGAIPIKRQNLMSAKDLFQLTRVILDRYPAITELTSRRLSHLPDLNDYWTANSNPLVYNMAGVDGLKTGSTNRAGYCLVATLPVETRLGTRRLVLVLLGAETAEVRGQAAEILLRYGETALGR